LDVVSIIEMNQTTKMENITCHAQDTQLADPIADLSQPPSRPDNQVMSQRIQKKTLTHKEAAIPGDKRIWLRFLFRIWRPNLVFITFMSTRWLALLLGQDISVDLDKSPCNTF
jgi:hypothetical protein